jgi:hypothetical protein
MENLHADGVPQAAAAASSKVNSNRLTTGDESGGATSTAVFCNQPLGFSIPQGRARRVSP